MKVEGAVKVMQASVVLHVRRLFELHFSRKLVHGFGIPPDAEAHGSRGYEVQVRLQTKQVSSQFRLRRDAGALFLQAGRASRQVPGQRRSHFRQRVVAFCNRFSCNFSGFFAIRVQCPSPHACARLLCTRMPEEPCFETGALNTVIRLLQKSCG